MNQQDDITQRPLTGDETRAAMREARSMTAPSDTTEPGDYVMAGARALLSKLRAPVADERAAFEAWATAIAEKYDVTRNGDHYMEPYTEWVWEAWQARAALASAPVQPPNGWACAHKNKVANAAAYVWYCKDCQKFVSREPGDTVQSASAPVAGEAVYTLSVKGVFHNWKPTTAAFSIPDGEHQLFLRPAAPQASAENVRDVNAAMAAEYRQWIDWFHKGRDYNSFLNECVFNKPQDNKEPA